MGLFSSAVSIIRYKVKGELQKPVIETVRNGLMQNMFRDMEKEVSEKISGWTCYDNHYKPDFTNSDFIIGPFFVFSLRIDKITISPKIIKKQYTEMLAEHLKNTGREYLSKHEKQSLKDTVIQDLSLRIPAIPNIYDMIWSHETSDLYFLNTLKTANEELETLFFKSFNLPLQRIIPFTLADAQSGLTDSQRDILSKLAPSKLF
ncbi:MAG: exonuclease [Desulfobacteraceae bacterium]|nr:exonuclease [Desulfobacteraceae bacterium]MBU4002092.1 exonuclease [Pseudomonadota bacterium]MBU4053441.1 exonuclease [Pseudomonadota bacterium]